MSRTAVRKHRTKSSVDPQPNPATARTENNTPHAPNNGSDVETQGKAPPARTTMKPATKASRVAGDSPVSISENLESFLKPGSPQPQEEEEDLWADSSHPPKCYLYLFGSCRRLDCPLWHPPREMLKPCRNFQEGRCRKRACPRPHIKLDELAVPLEDHTSSHSTVRETLSQPSYQPMQAPRDSVAPMKPMGHPEQTAGSEKSPAVSSSLGEATGSKDKEVCLKFSKGRCHKGSSCPRLHKQADSSTSQPPDVVPTTEQKQPALAAVKQKSVKNLTVGKQAQQAVPPEKVTPRHPVVGLPPKPQLEPVSTENLTAPSETASSRSQRKQKGKGAERGPISPSSSVLPPASASPDISYLPSGSSNRIQTVEDSNSISPAKEACIQFSRGRCRNLDCPRLHPPRYEWYKHYRKTAEPCLLHEVDMCSAGDRCIFTHYNYSDAENVPSKQPVASTSAFNNITTQHVGLLGNSNGREVRSSEDRKRTPFGQRNVSSPSTSTTFSSDTTRPISKKSNNSRALEKSKAIVQEYEPTEYGGSSTGSMPPSPSSVPIALYDDRLRRPIGEPEMQFCWDFLRGRCQRPRCRYKHVKDDDAPKRAAPLSANSSLSSIASTSTDMRQGTAIAVRPTNNKRAAPRTTNDTLVPIRSTKSVPVLPPGLGLEAKFGLNQPPRLPPEPVKSISVSVLDSVVVTFGPGLEVQVVRTGFESKILFVKGIPLMTSEEELHTWLTPFGEVAALRIFNPSHNSSTQTARVTMANHEQATAAVSGLDNTFIGRSRIQASLASHKTTSLGKGSVHDTQVLLEFPAPFRHGYVGYASQEDAERAIAQATGEELEECCLTAELFEGLPRISAWTVKFAGLPPNAKADILQKYGPNIGVMLGPPNYDGFLTSLRRLIRYLETFGELIELAVASPPYPRQLVHAYAHFVSPKVAENACRELNGRAFRTFGFQPLYARHSRSVNYTLPMKVFDAIKSDLIELRERLCYPDTHSRMEWFDKRRRIPDCRTVSVKVEAKEQATLTKLKTAFEKLLRGDMIQEDGRPIWDPFFDRPVGAQYIERLQMEYPYVLINRDTRRRHLALFGNARGRSVLRYILLDKVRELRRQTFQAFRLEGSLIRLYLSADLRKLQQDLGEENVRLDFETKTLKVRGNEDTMQVVRLLLRNSRGHHSLSRRHRGNDCPVCFSEVTLPVTLPCGHSWCKSCLVDYLLASVDTKVFPLLCLGDEARCKQPIPITVVREILSPDKFSQVTHAAFLGHIHSRPNEFYYCPTPDCPQVYRSAPPDTVLQCPSCLTRICGNCHVEEHVGKTCSQRDDDERRLFEQWSKFRDVKDCPSCKTHIERVAGCNHVTCAHCKTHICWVCLSTFSRSEAVYNHMNLVHGGIGL